LKLSLVDRLDACADDLRNIGTGVDTKAGDRRIDLHVARCEDQVCNDENLKINRRCTHNGDIQSAQFVQSKEDWVFAACGNIFDHCHQNAQYNTQQYSKQRDDQGVFDTLQISKVSGICKEGVIITLSQIENIVKDLFQNSTVPFVD